MGGSTYLAVTEQWLPIVSAIDSDMAWVHKVASSLSSHQPSSSSSAAASSSSSSSTQSVNLQHVYIGPTGRYGHPLNEDCRELWPTYPNAISSFSSSSSSSSSSLSSPSPSSSSASSSSLSSSSSSSSYLPSPDVIFVDGRFRVACIYATLLHTNTSEHNVRIMIHDFERSYYHEVLDYTEEVGR